MTALSTSFTNDCYYCLILYIEVSTVSPNVNTGSHQVSTASFSDNVVYAFMIENPYGSNLLQQDLEQIHEDDLEAMDLKWQLSLLSMGAKRYFQRTVKKFFINANDTAGYDKSKVECFNCHKIGHFAKECRAPRNKEGFHWSDMVEEQVQKNYRLIGESTVRFEEHLFERFSPFKNAFTLLLISNVTLMDYIGIFGNAYDDEDVGAEADLNNLETTMNVSPIPTIKIDKDHPKDQIIGDFNSAIQTRRMTKISDEHAMLPDENLILLEIPRKDNMYSVDMKNIVPKESLTYLVAKATLDESMLWHRRLGHINFKNFIKEIENLVDKKVKIIRSDNGTEFKNKVLDDFCREKGIKREYSIARTPQQNGVAERRNRTLIETARTMLADSKLPTIFWAEAISTACYVQNRVLVVKPHNKTPYELFRGFKPALSFMRPFGCHVTILNTLDNLGKFDGKSDEGFFVGYSLSSKAFRVYNTRTRRVEENLHIGFLENKPMIEGNGPKWLFDIDSLTQSMNYVPVAAGTITNESAGTQGELNAGTSTQKEEISQDCIVMPIWKDASYFDSPSKDVGNGEPKSAADDQKQVEDGPDNENDEKDKSEDDSSPKEVNTAGQHVNTASPEVNTGRFKLNTVDPSVNTASSYDQDSPKDMFTMGASHTLEATHVEFFSDEDEPEAVRKPRMGRLFRIEEETKVGVGEHRELAASSSQQYETCRLS
ncbi:putative ribonuclease H-like domain-containing protein [Tanacetum coccineum]